MAEEFGCLDLLIDDDFFFDFTESPPSEDFLRSSPDSANSWIGEIESQLMRDDENNEQQSFLELNQQSVSEFLADVFVDYPTNDSGPVVDSATAQVSDVPTFTGKKPEGSDDSEKEKKSEASNDSEKEKKSEASNDSEKEKKSEASNDSGSESQDGAKVESEIDGNDDVVAKKRTRRLRNRDAAVRSRERKKEYVQDLERKSKYLERECMRLGRMLDCFVAENNSLRLCLQKGSGNAFMTKQESAVLLLESLLLGSLLWFLGDIICQFPQPQEDTKNCLPVETRKPEKLVVNGQGRSSEPSNTGKTRRCKCSRPRMKHQILTLVA